MGEQTRALSRVIRDRVQPLGAEQHHVHALVVGDGALGFGIVGAKRVDLVAEQLDPHRFAAERHDIDDAAAPAPLAGRLGERHPLEAGGREPCLEAIEIEHGAGAKLQRRRRHRFGGRRRLEHGANRRHHDQRPGRAHERHERREPLGCDLRLRLQPAAERFPRRKAQHARRGGM